MLIALGGEHALPGFTGLRPRTELRCPHDVPVGEHALPGFTGLRREEERSEGEGEREANTPFPASRD